MLLSVLLTIAMVPVFSTLAVRWQLVDLPGARKVHSGPISRVGGIAMAVGIFVPVLLWNYADRFVWAYLSGAAIIVAFGMADDSRDLSPKWKLVGQLAAALLVVYFGGVRIHTLGSLLPESMLIPAWFAVPFTVLAIMGVTNAINLSDGLDGLAGGICLLTFCCIGYLAYLEEDFVLGLIALATAGAIFGFLRFNTYPASVFMGDTGSQLLGFTAITLSLDLTQGNTPLSPMLPLILLGFPILDTLSVMAVRIAAGRSPFLADRNHFHHNLLALGFQQTESVMVIYAVQSLLVVSAFLFRFHSDGLLLGGYLAFSVLVIALFTVAGRRGWRFREPTTELRDFFGSSYLRGMKVEGKAVRTLFRVLEFGLPVLLVFTCLLPADLPAYVAPGAALFLALILAVWWFRKDRLGDVVRMALYLLIPFVVYASTNQRVAWVGGTALLVYRLSFGALALLDIAVSKLSKRKDGFKSTPLDFLIVFLAVVVPNLPEQNLRAYSMGLIAAKTIVFYFSFEVLMAEQRGRHEVLAAGTVAALAVLIVKGLV
ncbi:MAG TPA: MraY family glycosyltransferase [Candidatus Methylomirabilis sp.]